MKTKAQNVETLILEKNIITRFGGFCSSNNTMMEEESDYDNDGLHSIEEYLFINYLNIS